MPKSEIRIGWTKPSKILSIDEIPPTRNLAEARECPVDFAPKLNILGEMNADALLERITCDPEIYGGKPIIRGRRLAVEHVLDLLAAGDDPQTIVEGYPWLELEDIQACLVYAYRLARHERIELLPAAFAP